MSRPATERSERTLRPVITLDHIALQAELLVHEIRAAAKDGRLEQADVDELHKMVAHCNLFLNPEGPTRG